jgi:hypothetical protein
MKFTRTFLTALTAAALALGMASTSFAAESNNPLDPAYKNSLQKLTASYFDMLKVMDVNHDGRISEKEFLNKHDPLNPSYEKAKAEFHAMVKGMDANKDGEICLEEYMADANPLHPGHKFTSTN